MSKTIHATNATYDAIKEPKAPRRSVPGKVKAILEDDELLEQFREDVHAHCTMKMLADKYEVSAQALSQNAQIMSIIKAGRAEHKAALLRKIAELALKGHKDSFGIMSALIFSLKNLCNWSDDGVKMNDEAPDEITASQV